MGVAILFTVELLYDKELVKQLSCFNMFKAMAKQRSNSLFDTEFSDDLSSPEAQATPEHTEPVKLKLTKNEEVPVRYRWYRWERCVGRLGLQICLRCWNKCCHMKTFENWIQETGCLIVQAKTGWLCCATESSFSA